MKFTPFTEADFEVINKEYSGLEELARKRCHTEAEFQKVQKAFDFANEAHKNVRRRSGEPYILHPIAVARIVCEEIGLGYKSIVTALLHDVVEDTEYTVEDIESLFGAKIAQLVDGLTKIKVVLDNEDRTKQSDYSSISLQAENFKRILLSLGEDARVVLIKLADRLHNCRTIEFMPEHKRDKILSETMYIFIPLAHRLGLYSVKSEMENIWLKFKEPDEYRKLDERINANVEQSSEYIDEFVQPIEEALKADGYKFTIKKRVKTPYSVWHKMRTKNIPFEQVFDLYAVRIVFDPESDDALKERKSCYDIYATITSLYRFSNDRLRDWIKQPKTNGYEALHCTFLSKRGVWVEVQIRSKRMDDIAEKGIAAHWAYKENGYSSENNSQMDKWMEQVKDAINSPDVGALELLDIIHKDLVSADIVVFTPKGHQRIIQTGATALDFAYLIHTDIGHHAIAAKVNMRLCPLSQVLRSGDMVEIITAENSAPKAEWYSFLQTRHAKRTMLDYLREHSPEEAKKIEAMQNMMSTEFIKAPERIVIKDDVRYIICSCCNPIPGDPVVGFKSEDGSIRVHKKSCRKAEVLASKFGDKMVVPHWVREEEKDFPACIIFRAVDRKGLLNQITSVISTNMGLNMRKLNIVCDKSVCEGRIELFVSDKSSLEDMIEQLLKIEGITSVVRTDI